MSLEKLKEGHLRTDYLIINGNIRIKCFSTNNEVNALDSFNLFCSSFIFIYTIQLAFYKT